MQVSSRVRTVPLLAAVSLAVVAGRAGASEADQILQQVEQAKPANEKLVFFHLDWVETLAEAKARALSESRPILLIWNRNISAPANFITGHC